MKPSLLATAVALFVHIPAMATEPLPIYGDSNLTLYFENDLFSGSDKDYTSGGRLSWISGNRPVEELTGLHLWLRYLIGDKTSFAPFQRVSGFNDASLISYNYGFALTQLIYTPADPGPFTPAAGDRPYAGVLLLGFSLHAMDENVLNTVAFSGGIVGPNAYAEETQDFIHSIRNIEKFNGWDSQIPNELLLNIHFDQKRRLSIVDYQNGIFAIDGYTEMALGLGNYRTEAQMGTLVRIGFNLPIEFSDPRLSPHAYSHKLFQSTRVLNSDWSLYSMFGAKGYLVAHDVTLDGPVFCDFSRDVKREPLVGEVFAGVGVRYTDWELSYVHTFRTREYDSQDENHSFGSVAIRKSF